MTDDMGMFSKRGQLEPDDYYLTPDGYTVFTSQYLLKRGYCCKSGCRHCPYGYDGKTGKTAREAGKSR